MNYVKETEPKIPANVQINVHVYANTKGLTKVYRETGLLADTEAFDAFMQGFNMQDGLCEIVYAGNGKECSDEKLKGGL